MLETARDKLEDAKDRLHGWKYKCTSALCSAPTKLRQEISDNVSEENKPVVAAQNTAIGTELTVKILYEGKDSVPGYYDWVDVPPRQISEKVTRKNERIAIRVCKIIDREKESQNGRHTLKTHMIQLQNPTLIEALKPIVEKENVFLDVEDTCEFKAPFRPLWFCYDEIQSCYKKSKDGGVLKPQLGLLLKVMGDIFGGLQTKLKSLQTSQLITFNLSWAYYPRDTVVYCPLYDTERLFKVDDCEYKTKDGNRLFVLSCQEIIFDGEGFVWSDIQLSQPEYAGNQPITDLKFYPLHLHKNAQAIRNRLTARGIKVLDFQALSYQEYTGLGILEKNDELEKHNVDGRILIDTYGYAKHHLGLSRRSNAKDKKSQRKKITETVEEKKLRVEEKRRTDSEKSQDLRLSYDMETDPPLIRSETEKVTIEQSYLHRLTQDEQEENKKCMLQRPDILMFMSPMLRGFAMNNKLWLSFYVDDIRPVTWNDSAFSHLVYPEEQKDLVLSFVQNHRRTTIDMDDVVKGKGQGLIFLLSGPPGTGKTLTAEAVADKTRRPLFYLQAEDLGINAASLGEKLKRCFEMATEWDAVILLDESDVFMAERHPNDIGRNELVSIFLRETEYFRGILFLTTNLYETIDAAFRSRVNIHLLFNPLAAPARLILWKKFLDRIPLATLNATSDAADVMLTLSNEALTIAKETGLTLDVSEADLHELSLYNLNGREIKNAIKTVKSWCEVKNYDITLARLESAIKATAPQAIKSGGAGSGAGRVDELYD